MVEEAIQTVLTETLSDKSVSRLSNKGFINVCLPMVAILIMHYISVNFLNELH